jgi:DNA-binding NarL/FixJ family response regulator
MSKCIFIVDDNAVVRRCLRGIFENEGWEICGEAENGHDAIEKAPRLHPDLIILDLSMPVMNGVEAAPRLRKMLPEVPIVMFSIHGGALEHEALSAGVAAVVSKTDNMKTLVRLAGTLVQADRRYGITSNASRPSLRSA